MLVEAKSNLAKLMASENLIVEQRNVRTAMFDLKSRILTVPSLSGNLSSELYDLLLGHEVGHALETPEKGWHDSVIDLKVNKTILNVCEDARIEKKIKRKFPGIRISFVKGYKEMMEMDFFGIKDTDVNKLNFIDRVNLHTKCGSSQVIKFTNKEVELLKEVEETETFDEVVIVAQKIQNYMKADQEAQEEEKKRKLKITIKKGKPSDGDGEALDSINLDDYDEVEIVEDGSESDGEGTETNQETPEQKGDEKSEVYGAGKLGSDTGYTESMTDKSFREKEKSLHTPGKECFYANVPEVILDNIVVPHKKLYSIITKEQSKYKEIFNMTVMKNNYNKFCKDSNKVVSYLVKEFELRKNAEQMARSKVSKTGELNMSKLHNYKFTDDIFRRMTKVPNGKSHGLVMYIDWSGSMDQHINATIKQLLNLSLFCRKVNIPFEVYAFSSNGIKSIEDGIISRYHDDITPIQKPLVGDINVNSFTLLNLLSSKMNTKDFTEAACYLLDYGTSTGRTNFCTNYVPPNFMRLSGTPLNETIITAFTMVPKFKEDNKLEIVNTVFLTDGEGSPLTERYAFKKLNGGFSFDSKVLPGSHRSFIRDTKTKSCVEVEVKDYNYSGIQTIALLKLLKQRLECNLIGFFVCNSSDARSVLQGRKDMEKHIMDFKKNNFTFIKDCGYDEQYLLKSDSLDTDDEGFNPLTNTTHGLTSSFKRYNKDKINSRIVLNRFINLIA